MHVFNYLLNDIIPKFKGVEVAAIELLLSAI